MDGELIADLWRRTWYRGSQRTARASRLEYVEHEGLVTVLARRAGARVPEVVTAGRGDDGDALIAVRPDGVALLDNGGSLESQQLGSLWDQLEILHGAGIVHRRIDLERIAKHNDGTAGFSDLASASLQCRDADKRETTPNSSPSASSPPTRTRRCDRRVQRWETKRSPPCCRTCKRPRCRREFAARCVATRSSSTTCAIGSAAQLDVSDIELAKLRRVTWKSMLNLALLIVATYTLIGMLSGIDLGSFWRALGDANWWWLAAALVIGQTPRIANAVSTMGSTTQSLPLGPTSMMQFAAAT